MNLEFLKSILESGDYDEVFVALSEKFRKAVEGLEKISNVEITYIKGKEFGAICTTS